MFVWLTAGGNLKCRALSRNLARTQRRAPSWPDNSEIGTCRFHFCDPVCRPGLRPKEPKVPNHQTGKDPQRFGLKRANHNPSWLWPGRAQRSTVSQPRGFLRISTANPFPLTDGTSSHALHCGHQRFTVQLQPSLPTRAARFLFFPPSQELLTSSHHSLHVHSSIIAVVLTRRTTPRLAAHSTYSTTPSGHRPNQSQHGRR